MEEREWGSLELRNSLPLGTLKKIAHSLNTSTVNVSEMVRGNRNPSNPFIINCAKEIADAYKESGFEDKRNEILEKYGKLNQTRN
jgi:hypothetical protein